MTLEKYEIKNRWTNEVQVTAEIECSADMTPSIKLGLAIKWAVKEKADLYGANLDGASLDGANLTRANLTMANLYGANLTRANLDGANLYGAELAWADLYGANLDGANLYGANLYGANLTRAELAWANLTRANLTRASLDGANHIPDIALAYIKADFWMTLTYSINEVPALIDALKNGRVDGSQYEGECACLVGTLANAAHIQYTKLPHNASAPAEVWFAKISKGNTPYGEGEGAFAARKALEWAEEFQDLHAKVYA